MNGKMKEYYLSFKFLNWKAVLLFGIALFYTGLIVIWSQQKASPLQYGGDYLAFWSAGKIADEFGFSKVYDLPSLAEVQTAILEGQSGGTNTLITALPAPFFSIFLVPFKFLSRFEIQISYWFWAVLNLLVLGGYLAFFLKSVFPEYYFRKYGIILLALLVSFPVFDNFVNGQLNVFLLVCVGEFIRNAVKQRPFISGLWLGGLLLKPQLLLLIIPVLLIQRQWKVFWGFITTSVSVFLLSLALSGVNGMIAYAQLLAGWGQGNSVTAPEAMINWRMIAVLINSLAGSPSGWIVAAIGTIITLVATYLLIKQQVEFGSSDWVFMVLGVMTATLVVTWHAHVHMSIVIVPLLLYAVVNEMLHEKYIIIWAVMPLFALLGIGILGIVFLQKVKIIGFDYQSVGLGLPGFIANLLILRSIVRKPRFRKAEADRPLKLDK